MRISVILLIFFVLLNGWGALLQHYHMDDYLGINAETGNPQELTQAVSTAKGNIKTGQTFGQTLLGFYNNLMNTVEGLVAGLGPGVQMLVNLAPRGIVEDIVVWVFAFLPIVIAVDILAYARGVDL